METPGTNWKFCLTDNRWYIYERGFDSHHLSYQCDGLFTQYFSISSVSVGPSVLISFYTEYDFFQSHPVLIQVKSTSNVHSLYFKLYLCCTLCIFCISLGSRKHWRHSATVTAAGKLVISDLVCVSPLQWGYSLSPGDYARQLPVSHILSWFSCRAARASDVLFILNKITSVCKLFQLSMCPYDSWTHQPLFLLTKGVSHSHPFTPLSSGHCFLETDWVWHLNSSKFVWRCMQSRADMISSTVDINKDGQHVFVFSSAKVKPKDRGQWRCHLVLAAFFRASLCRSV